MEVAPLKSLFFLAVLKLDVKDSFGYDKEIERREYTLPGMYFSVNLKIKKATLCSFTGILFIELNFTVAFLLIRKTWDYQFAGKMREWRILRNDGILVMGV